MSAFPPTDAEAIVIESAAAANIASVHIFTAGEVTVFIDSTSSGALYTLATGTIYRIKVRYVRGTGSNETMEIWITSDVEGSWGTSKYVTAIGTSTVRAGRMLFVSWNDKNQDLTIDNVKVSTSDILWTDLN